MKIKENDKGKAKPCKTIIIEEGAPPAPPFCWETTDVIARLFQERIGSRHWTLAVLHCARLDSGRGFLRPSPMTCGVSSSALRSSSGRGSSLAGASGRGTSVLRARGRSLLPCSCEQ